MRPYLLALACFAFAHTASAQLPQSTLPERVKVLEEQVASLTARLTAVESRLPQSTLDPLTQVALRGNVGQPCGIANCQCGCVQGGVCTCNTVARTGPLGVTRYRTVCTGSGCSVVPVTENCGVAYQIPVSYGDAPMFSDGGCASGNCGGGRRRLFGRWR